MFRPFVLFLPFRPFSVSAGSAGSAGSATIFIPFTTTGSYTAPAGGSVNFSALSDPVYEAPAL